MYFHMWELRTKKHVSTAWTNNYFQQYSVGCIYLYMICIYASRAEVFICSVNLSQALGWVWLKSMMFVYIFFRITRAWTMGLIRFNRKPLPILPEGECLNTLRPRHNGHHFPEDIFKYTIYTKWKQSIFKTKLCHAPWLTLLQSNIS